MDENNRQKNRQKKIGDALMKVALGCRIEEVTEEFAEVDGELRLTRRRETRKDIPPVLKAVQMLLTGDAEDSDASDAGVSDAAANAAYVRSATARKRFAVL